MGNHNTVDSQDNPGVARTAWNATGGKIRSLSPTLRQVVTGLTVCQVIMVAVSSVTLGALVNRNANVIGLLEKEKEDMQAKINLLESKVDAGTSLSHKLDNDNDRARITQLETDHLDINTTTQTLDARTMQLEIARIVDQENIQALNNTLTQLTLNITENEDRIAKAHLEIGQLDIERTNDRVSIQKLNESIAQLEFDGTLTEADIELLNKSINNLELNNTKNSADIQNLYANISKLKSDGALDQAFAEMLNDSIAQLQIDFSTQSQALNDQNLSLIQIKEDVEANKDSIRNISDMLSVVDIERQTDVAAIEANTNRLSKLEHEINATNDAHSDLELRVSNIEDGLNCIWGDWTASSNCSVDGVMHRERVCESQNPGFTGLWCSRKDIEIQTCDPGPVHGGWGEWGDFSTCSQTCNGTETRERVCDSPIPSYGGQPCSGGTEETQDCNICFTVHGGWGEWSAFSTCSKTCDGTETRQRVCDSPSPTNGGEPCPGNTEETQACNIDNCITVHGGWGGWSAFSTCSKTCDGTETRERVCDSPSPEYGGTPCIGSSIETRACNTDICVPVHGGWGSWGAFSTCSVSCGGGTYKRQRACNNPSPAYGGSYCPGYPEETQSCNTVECVPVDCSELDGNPTRDGVFRIYPGGDPGSSTLASCVFDSGEAWTVIQYRVDGSQDFFKYWDDYKWGFGDPHNEYWLGNEYIHQITSRQNYMLKIELWDWVITARYAQYSTFEIANEDSKYRLTISGYSGDAGDGLISRHNGMPFSTRDSDNDSWHKSCASEYYGAWWYARCGHSCLNGEFIFSYYTDHYDVGIKWAVWHEYYSLRLSKMMIRKN